jgi:hypothetical protein
MQPRPFPFPGNPAYLDAVFLADCPATGWPERFAIVTACNPVRDRQATADENARENARLLADLLAAGRQPFPVTGASPDLRHQEAGWGFACESPVQAAESAAAFDQDAFFWVENGRIFLAADGSGYGWPVAPWRDRLIGLTPRSTSGTT